MIHISLIQSYIIQQFDGKRFLKMWQDLCQVSNAKADKFGPISLWQLYHFALANVELQLGILCKKILFEIYIYICIK